MKPRGPEHLADAAVTALCCFWRGKTFNTSEAKAFSVFPFIPKAQRRARVCKFRPIISVFPHLNASFFAPRRWKMIMCLTSEKEMSPQAELSFEVKKKKGGKQWNLSLQGNVCLRIKAILLGRQLLWLIILQPWAPSDPASPCVPLISAEAAQQQRLYSRPSWPALQNPQEQETEAKQFHMADAFRTQTCVMVTSHGSGTSHPNTLPLGQSGD